MIPLNPRDAAMLTRFRSILFNLCCNLLSGLSIHSGCCMKSLNQMTDLRLVMELDDWQALVNKPVFTSDGKDVGVVSQIQPEKIIVTYGPITPDKYVIPKSSVRNIERGVVYLSETGSFIEDNYKYE